MNKAELVFTLKERQDEFLKKLDGFDEMEMSDLQTDDGWSIKMIISHLTRWEAELVKLLWQVRQGQQPTTIHFSGASVDEINARWLADDQSRPLDRILEDFLSVRRQTIRRIQPYTDEELNDPQLYLWLNGRPLSDWIADDSFEHEAEHTAQIEQLQSRRQKE